MMRLHYIIMSATSMNVLLVIVDVIIFKSKALKHWRLVVDIDFQGCLAI